MARKRKDPLEEAIEEALVPGAFIGHRDIWDFVEELEAVTARIQRLIKDEQADRAAGLLEAFLAGCYQKSEEIDDSSGSFGMFVEGLFCSWIRARQAARTDPDETADMLLSGMENDDYGYCRGLEKEAVKALDRRGLASFERALRSRPDDGQEGPHRQRQKAEILMAIHAKRRDVDAYVAACEDEAGLAPVNCEVLAGMCLKRRKPQDALGWVERGLALQTEERWSNRGGWGLRDLRREILKKLGRAEEALAAGWEDYRTRPSVYAYRDLMKYAPKAERPEWHSKALRALDRAGLSDAIEVLVMTKEWDHLAGVIEAASREMLMAHSHYVTEPAARKLTRSHPLLAAKLHAALGLRILKAKKSKYYAAALQHFELVRRLLLRAGQDQQWQVIVDEVRDQHRRKSAFMPDFERLVEGRTSKGEASYLDQARKRWARKTGRPSDAS